MVVFQSLSACPASPTCNGDFCVAGPVGATDLERWLDRNNKAQLSKRGQCGVAGLPTQLSGSSRRHEEVQGDTPITRRDFLGLVQRIFRADHPVFWFVSGRAPQGGRKLCMMSIGTDESDIDCAR